MPIVGDLQAHVLLHPIRMRVVLALGTEELTTKQIHAMLPDVAQASLYRAVARLVEAGVISVVDRRKRGGAVERVYRVVDAPHTPGEGASPSDVVAAADALAGALSVDATRWASDATATRCVALRREVLTLTDDDARALADDIAALVDAAAARGGTGAPTAVTYAIVPGLEARSDAS